MSLIKFVKEKNIAAITEMMENSDPTEMIGKIFLNDQRGWTSLHHASFLGEFHILKLLLSNMTGRDAMDAVSREAWSGDTCLLVACRSDADEAVNIVHYLLSLGADPNAGDQRDETPLVAACSKKGNLEIVKLLVTMGADLLKETSNTWRTPLSAALVTQDKDMVDYLLKQIQRLNAPVTHWSYAFALINMPEIVPVVLRLMGVEKIRQFLSEPSHTTACRHLNNAITFQNYDPTGSKITPFQWISLATNSVGSGQSLDDFASILSYSLSLAKINLSVDDPEEETCQGGLLKYFPELDIRQKISLKAQARHSFRCGLNKKYNGWMAYKWLKNDMDCPGLKSYLLYEDEPTIIEKGEQI